LAFGSLVRYDIETPIRSKLEMDMKNRRSACEVVEKRFSARPVYLAMFVSFLATILLSGCDQSVVISNPGESIQKSAKPDSTISSDQKQLNSTVDVGNSPDGALTRGPNYKNKLGYCLFVFGTDSPVNVWVIKDGDELYVDRNANGDLADDGGPLKVIEQKKLVKYQDADYEPVLIRSADGVELGELCLGFYQTDQNPIKHVVKFVVDETVQSYAGWHQIFSDSKESASTFYFNGKYVIQQLRGKNLSLSDDELELHLRFVIRGIGKSATTKLSISEVPKEVSPEATIVWPNKHGSSESDLSQPISKVSLVERC